MKILVLSFYYYPDLSAGSFRTTALVKALVNKLTKDDVIDVVSTLPNRYQGYAPNSLESEKNNGLEIHRIKLPSHRGGMLDQSRAFYCFAKQVLTLIRDREYDLVYATSSRLMTAALGAYVARRKKTKLYLDLRDIFTDTIKDVLSVRLSWLLLPMLTVVERWTVTRADKVNLVSKGFGSYFMRRYPNVKYSFFSNGVDEDFINVSTFNKRVAATENHLVVLYAGNIGAGQGLHKILPVLAKKMQDVAVFKVIGEGGKKDDLIAEIENAGVKNIELLPPMSRHDLIKLYMNADILFLHLNNYEAFEKVLPSKLFEYAATGKPIWAGVAGYPAEFVNNEISNSVTFKPCDIDDAQLKFKQLSVVNDSRDEFTNKYNRTKIMSQFSEDILSLLRKDA